MSQQLFSHYTVLKTHQAESAFIIIHFRCWVPLWFYTNIWNHAPKERVHYVFLSPHQGLCC